MLFLPVLKILSYEKTFSSTAFQACNFATLYSQQREVI